MFCTLDHNECLKNTNACEHECHNSHGAYYCSCTSGYRLATNNKTCDGNAFIQF